jgi:hypothetical protein
MKKTARRYAVPFRLLALASFIAQSAIVSAISQQQCSLLFMGELGVESETGEPGALVARELFRAGVGRLSGSADVASAIGIAAGNGSSLIDSAGLHLAYLLGGFKRSDFLVDTYVRYRSFFEDAWELRLGGTVIGRWGKGLGAQGLFGDWALGFEEIRTAIGSLPISLWQGNPLFRAAIGWRFSPQWAATTAIESFSDEDASYLPRILFDSGVNLDLAAVSLQARAMLKYSDFFTPTGYLDGIAFRIGATVPLRRGLE